MSTKNERPSLRELGRTDVLRQNDVDLFDVVAGALLLELEHALKEHPRLHGEESIGDAARG